MQLTRQQRVDIGLQAIRLDERLQRGEAGGTDSPRDCTEEAQRVLAAWKRVFAGDAQALRGRLAWDRLDERSVLQRLSQPLDRREPAAWTGWLDRFARKAATASPTDSAMADIPFVELLAPLVLAARAELRAIVPDLAETISSQAGSALEQSLLREFARTAELALYERFCATRKYREFVADTLADGYAELFVAFPVLARQLAQLASSWVSWQAELIARVRQDTAAIESEFGLRTPLGKLIDVDASVSDRHDNGRRVGILQFEPGFRLVYKPRDLGLERAYSELLAWLRVHGLEAAPPGIRVLTRPGYGWAEFVEQTPLATERDVERYFVRAGSLTCVAHLLRGKDLHMDNVIATADGPVVVDAEMLFQPERADEPGAKDPDNVERSCLSTGLLSLIETDRDGAGFDVGGYRGQGGFLAPTKRRVWENLGTDALRPAEVDAYAPATRNRPSFAGAPRSIDRYAAQFLEGFTNTYRFFRSHRDALFGSAGPLTRFAGEKVRVLIRPTRQYGFVLQALTTPKFQRSGLQRDLALESMQRNQDRRVAKPRYWPLVADERLDVVRLDVPRFSLGADETLLFSHTGEPVPGLFCRSGYSMVCERIAAMDESDLARQQAWLRFSLANSPGSSGASPAAPPPRETEHKAGCQEDRASRIDRAIAIGDEIFSRARQDSNGGICWGERAPGQPEGGADLYSGLPGTAILFAALARITGDSVWVDRTETTLRPLRRTLGRQLGLADRRESGLGIGDGIGSTIYALGTIGTLLRQPEPIQDAARIAREIDPEQIDTDRAFDLMSGSAGLLLALLILADRTGSKQPLEQAVRCGEHLLLHQVPSRHGGAAWPLEGERLMTGWAHGAAGIGFALGRLAAVTGDERFRRAELRAFEYERALYSESRRNWPIVGLDGEPEQFLIAWCHGAPGVALSRGLSADRAENDGRIAELDAAMATAGRRELGRLDHLCCGNLGRSEVLLTLGRKLNRGDAIAAAEDILLRVLRRSDASGQFSLSSTRYVYRTFDPGFFRGLAGIAYQLLRSIAATELPSVLAFESESDLV